MHLKGNLEAFSLKSSLMGCSSLSLCRLQCDRECNIWALFLRNEKSLLCKADQKHLCVLSLQVEQRWSVMDKLSQDFWNQQHSHYTWKSSLYFKYWPWQQHQSVHAALSAKVSVVIYQVSTIVSLKVSRQHHNKVPHTPDCITKQISFYSFAFL